MSDTTQAVCICTKPATNRCSACKTVSYCSPECQRSSCPYDDYQGFMPFFIGLYLIGDWKTHKVQCKVAASRGAGVGSGSSLRQGSASELQELVRVGAKVTIYDESMALGLDPSLISGASGAEFYEEKDGSENFWRLEAPVREQWEAKAKVHNRKSQRFWMTYLAPLSIGREWIDIILDAVLNVRLPSHNNAMWQDQVNANALSALFPHLRHFTPAQNTALLDIFASRRWYDDGRFRLETGTTILLAHGQPTMDLIEQLIGRCLSWTRPYSEIDQLLSCAALPIQKHWSEVVGTRILDVALAMLSPGRPGPPGGRTVPGDRILEIAESSPAACKHLLPVIMMMCRARMISNPAARLLGLFDTFGVAIRGEATDVLPWLMVEFVGDDHNTQRLQQLLREEMAGKQARFGIEAKDPSLAELKEMNRAAMERLGNPKPL
ncbi:hypothetical protein B0H11DRAFT_2114471 [Mycena galericulata]|nr:hypothetical protein B0H11DRAFT_2114471 [Mycena galericulata]